MTEKFPQYRKYSNDLVFFRIDNPSLLVELKLIGERYYQFLTLKAEKLPDRNHIGDLLQCAAGGIVQIDMQEFEAVKRDCETSRTLLQ